jgi:hypothetical protein
MVVHAWIFFTCLHILVYENNIWANMVYTRMNCNLRSYHFSSWCMGTVLWCFSIIWYLSNAYHTILRPGHCLKWKQHSIHQVSEILLSELDILVYTIIYQYIQSISMFTTKLHLESGLIRLALPTSLNCTLVASSFMWACFLSAVSSTDRSPRPPISLACQTDSSRHA